MSKVDPRPRPGGRGNMIARNDMLAARLRELWPTTATLIAIADEMKCGTSTVVRASVELELPPRKEPGELGSQRVVGETRPPLVCTGLPELCDVVAIPEPRTIVIEPPPRRCQWIVSADRPWKFCNRMCLGVYCVAHHKIAKGKAVAA